MNTSAKDDVLILGAGAVGLTTALALLEAGRGVHVIEAREVGAGASHGNCGTITPSHAPPLAAPGVILHALRWMLKPDAPLYVKPRVDPVLWRWLLAFASRCNRDDWLRSAAGRAAILNDSRSRLAAWIGRYELDCEFGEDGLDYVFRDRRNFEHHVKECADLKTLGIATEVIDGADYLRQEPALLDGVAGAIRFPHDAHLRPDRYVAELARVVRGKGGVIEENCRALAVRPARNGVEVVTSQGRRNSCELVVALGAWSPPLARSLRLRLPIQPGKGYSITCARPSLAPRRPLLFKDVAVFVTPWQSGLRLGGTMEFSGYDDRLNALRLGALERAARAYLRDGDHLQVQERWCGWRPMTYDDLPAIGRSPRDRNVWLAAGHGMLGISMSAATGQLVADLMTGAEPAIDPAPYAPERFQ